MRVFESCILLIFALFGLCRAQSQSKALCYSGSTLYQQITVDCSSKNPNYNGTWYCSKIEVCESFISPYRECIVTRGCATYDECSDGANNVYSNTEIKVNGVEAAGMTMTATCCVAHDFPQDDTIAIDYTEICNSATSLNRLETVGILALLMAAISVYFMHN